MKLNRSHILLISLISIFLLLSISAASAASDADAIVSDTAIDDISEYEDIDNNINDVEILSQGDEETISDEPVLSEDVSEELADGEVPSDINTTIEADNQTFQFGDNVTIDFALKDNDSNIINNTDKSNFKVFYKNATEEDFNQSHTLDFNITNNGTQFEFKNFFKKFAVGNYTLKLQFLNSTIDGKNYIGSEVIIDLNVTITDTRIDATDTKVKITDDVIIPLKLYVHSNKTLNANASRVIVVYGEQNYTCLNTTGGNNITNGIKIPDFPKAVGNYTITIRYLGNDNCKPSEKTIILSILGNNTIQINDNVTVDFQTHNVTVPFSVYENGTLVNVTEDKIILKLVYDNGTEIETKYIYSPGFVLSGEEGSYNISFKEDVPFNNVRLTLIYANGTLNETNKTIAIMEDNNVIFKDNITVDFGNYNITLPIIVNHTSIIYYDGKTIENVSTLPLSREDLTLELIYKTLTGNQTVIITDYNLDQDENGTNILSLLLSQYQLNDAKLNIIFKNGTLDEAKKTIGFIVNNTIISNVSATEKVNNHTRNVTIPIGINQTAIVSYDGKTITNVSTINITDSDLKLLLTYNNGTENATVNFVLSGENGTYDINATINEGINFDNATLTIIYADNTLNATNKSITLKEFIDLNIAPVNATMDYQDGEFIFKVTDAFNGDPIANTNITATGLWFFTFGNTTSMSGSKVFTTDANGLLKIKNENLNPNLDIVGYMNGFVALPVGSYNLTFRGNDSLVLNMTETITVSKAQVKIVANNMVSEYGDIVTYTYQVVNSKTGNPLKLVNTLIRVYGGNLDATRGGTTNKTGHYTSPSLSLTANTYKLDLKTNDTNLICTPVTKTLTVNKSLATITASSRTVYYGATDDIVLTVKDKKTGKVLANTYVLMKIYTTAKKYVAYAVATNSKGALTFSPPSALTVGKHKVILSVLDNNYNSTSYTRYITVKKAPAKFTASKVTTYYRSGRLYKVRLVNTKTKKGLYGARVLVKVYISKKKFYKYAGNTSNTGYIQFKIDYKPSTYKVEVTNNNDKGYSAKTITRKIKVTKHPIKFKAVSLYVQKGKYYKVKAISKKNKKALSSVKVIMRLYDGKKYKTYTRKTNKNGIASLKINKKIGKKYKVVVMNKATKLYTAKKLTKKVKVVKYVVKMTPDSLKVKKGSTFKVKVTNSLNKKALKNIKVNIRVYTGKKYKTYTKKTNKKGLASIKVTQAVGKHKVVISNVDTKNYYGKKVTKTLNVLDATA